jgi:hypothetical protein
MLMDALVLATLSTIGFVFAWKKLPRNIRRFLQKHALLTDIITFLLTYITLGSSLTALTAGSIVAIFTSMLMHIVANPNDFLYIYDFVDLVKNTLGSMQSFLQEYGAKYRQQKGLPPTSDAKIIQLEVVA